MFEEQFQEERERINEELESFNQDDSSSSTSGWSTESRKDDLMFRQGIVDIFSESLSQQFESDEYRELVDYTQSYVIDTTLDGTGNRVDSQRIKYSVPSFLSTNEDNNFSLDLNGIIYSLFYSMYDDTGYTVDHLENAEVKIKEYTSRLTQPVTTGTPIRFSAGQNFEIFDALFVGYMVDQEFRYYITRIDDDSVEFLLDDTDVSHPNVTIEGNPSE